jgi:hypothetical protein
MTRRGRTKNNMSDDDQNPWDSFWQQRAPGLWTRPDQQGFERRMDTILNRPFVSNAFDPRPGAPLPEDQRGLTLPELDLQAKFQRARALGPWAEKAGAFLDPAAAQSEAARDLGVGNVEDAAKRIALAHAGDILSMHAPTGPAPPPPKKVIKKKEVK